MTQEINYRKKTRKFANVDIKEHATQQPMSQIKNQKRNLKVSSDMKMELQHTICDGMQWGSFKRAFYNNQCHHQETRKVSAQGNDVERF